MLPLEKAPAPIQLFDWQEEDRAKTVAAFLDRRQTRLLGVWPTGAGKTIMFSELHLEDRMANWLDTYPSHRKKILVIAHRDELISQAVDKLRRSNPNLHVSVEKAERRADPMADVVVASVQTLTASRGKRMKKMRPQDYRIVVIDEAHHTASPSYLAIAQYFGFLPPPDFMLEARPKRADGKQALLEWQRMRLGAWDQTAPDRLLLGVTATPQRGDKIGLECVFQEVAFCRTIRELIQDFKRLCPIRAYRVESATSLDDVATRAGDFKVEELSQTINITQRNEIAVRAYLDYAKDRKGITFCATVAHAISMAKTYQAAGVSARAIYGTMNDTERAKVLEDYRAGRITMLTNCQILTEGFDEPDVQVIVHARPTKSSLLYIQMTGRGLRVAPGKQDCIIIDIVDVTKKHSLITSPELLGLPAGFDAKGGSLLEIKQQIEETAAAHPTADFGNVKSVDDVQLRVKEVDLLSSFHDDIVTHNANLAWRPTGEGYEIDWHGTLRQEVLQLVRQPDGWDVVHWIGQTPAWKRKVQEPAAAFKAAEDYLRQKASHIYRINQRTANWRTEPASAAHKSMLQGMKANVNLDTLTKGDAQLLIADYYSKQRKAKGRV